MNAAITALLVSLGVSPLQPVAPTDFAVRFEVIRCGHSWVMDTFTGVFTFTPAGSKALAAAAALPAQSMRAVHEVLIEGRFFEYPVEFFERSSFVVTHRPTYRVRVRLQGKSHEVNWDDSFGADSEEAARLRSMFEEIKRMIDAAPDVQKVLSALGVIPC